MVSNPHLKRKKNLVNKNQGWEPIFQKYKVNENTSRHNPKKKQKQTINKNKVKTLCKDLMQKGLVAMTINDNKEDLKKKVVIYHKWVNDGGALTMMCGRNEEP